MLAAGQGQAESQYEGVFGAGYFASDTSSLSGPIIHANMIARPASGVTLRFSLSHALENGGNTATIGALEVTGAIGGGYSLGGYTRMERNSSIGRIPEQGDTYGLVLRKDLGNTQAFVRVGQTHHIGTRIWFTTPQVYDYFLDEVALGISRDVSDRFSYAMRLDLTGEVFRKRNVFRSTVFMASGAALYEPRPGFWINGSLGYGTSRWGDGLIASIGGSIDVGKRSGVPMKFVADLVHVEDLTIGQSSDSAFLGIEIEFGGAERRIPSQSYAAGIFDQY